MSTDAILAERDKSGVLPPADAHETRRAHRPAQPPGAPAFLSTAAATPAERRLAVAMVGLSSLVFVVLAPFAAVEIGWLPAFIPLYEAALVVGDLVTAVLLFGQFAILRSRALLVLAAGYLFTALMASAHALTFPGLFAPTGLLGAGPQSTAWLYMFWHAGFPLAVIAYARLQNRPSERLAIAPSRAIAGAVAAVVAAVASLAWLATAGSAALPTIMIGNRHSPAMIGVVTIVWMLSPLGLLGLWRRRPRTVLDLWLIVVLSAWVFDVALSAVLNATRSDVGFYAGRIYGLVAANFVLIVLLLETTRLYGRLAAAADELATYADTLETRVHRRTRDLERAHAEERRAHRLALENARALAAAQSLNQRIFETTVDLILVTDPKGTFVQVSPSAEAILGYAPEEMVGRSAADFVYPDDLEKVRDEMRRTRRGRIVLHFETRYRHRDGHVVPLGWAGVWSEPEQRYYFTGRDMTERVAAEEQLRQAQKMEAVGQLTGGLAHDFNNLLGIVIGNLDLLEERVAADADAAELLGEALGASLRGAELTRQLLAFSRRQPLQPKLVEPNTIVRTMSKLLARTIGEQIAVRLALADEVWPVLIDAAQLESALLNLAVNARDAMPHGGTLTIETANFSFDGEEAATHVDGAAGDYVLVAVSDTGTGVAPDVVARVFEPFFSTKGVGKGTGLGLSMVYGFVKQSGGNASIYSEVGVGTTIRLYLPRATTGTAAADIAAPALVAARGGERVLVVEDKPALRRLALRQLGELGYVAEEAAGAAEALAVLAQDDGFDLLFTDVVMPGGIDGHELARRARALHPRLRVLFTSGFTAAAVGAGAAWLDRLISKPFRKAELAQRVRATLDASD